jgi:hypothetical protein
MARWLSALDRFGSSRLRISVGDVGLCERDVHLGSSELLSAGPLCNLERQTGRRAPEQPKSFVEDRQILLAVDEERSQREVEIGPASNRDVLKRFGGVDHPTRLHFDSCAAQQTDEMQQIPQKKGRG